MNQIGVKCFIVLICFFIGTSCEMTNEIDYKTTGKSDWIVLNGFISYEYGVNVLIKKTVPPNELDADDVIENPTVWLYENKKPLKKLLKIDEYKYWLPADSIQFDKKASYSIKAEAENLETVVSIEQQFVSKTEIDTVYIVRDTVNWRDDIYFEFDDDTTVANYYSDEITYFKDGNMVNERSKSIVPKYCYSDDGFQRSIIVTRSLFRNEFDSVQVNLFSVSKNYYDFISSYGVYEISYSDFSYETVYTVESQIENGFGFFAGYEVCETIIKNTTKTKENE